MTDNGRCGVLLYEYGVLLTSCRIINCSWEVSLDTPARDTRLRAVQGSRARPKYWERLLTLLDFVFV
jgi:hypothetical protein